MTNGGEPARVLVLDGETRKALAVVRSLGRIGLTVGVVSSREDAIAGASRYRAERFLSPDAKEEPARYVEWLLAHVERWKPAMLLPLTDRSVTLVLGEEERFAPLCTLPFVPAALFRSVADKAELVRIADTIGVAAPRTLSIPPTADRPEGLAAEIETFPFPAVLKPAISETIHGDRFVKTAVRYVESAVELLEAIDAARNSAFRDVPHLLQERIPGVGVGVFVLCHEGEVLARFCHRRVLEKPPSGGVSVLCESIPESEAPVEEAIRLATHLRWSGVAMVEFKETPEGKHVLMEINPRFWGSLQLAIDAGVDFPALLYRLYEGGHAGAAERLDAVRAEGARPYAAGYRLRWLLGTADHGIIRLKRWPARTLRDIFTKNALQLLAPGHYTRLQVFREDDMKPFFLELRRWFADILPGKRRD